MIFLLKSPFPACHDSAGAIALTTSLLLLSVATACMRERLGSLHLRLGSHSTVQALLGHGIFLLFWSNAKSLPMSHD